ncbi:MAG TPA: tetratricopeptide repeat protein [Candidatus Acidoferrum sp.]|nr:tetratricopeptide repeat protein [Candidatus Acidoferrum sp.]
MSISGAPIHPEGSALGDKKLISWKEIAIHLGREVRTVQRWEKSEGLPVRRHEHLKKSTVYAYASELDEWFRKRQPTDDPEADAAFEPELDATDASSDPTNGKTDPVAGADTVVENDESDDPHGEKKRTISKWKRYAFVFTAAALIFVLAYVALHGIQPVSQRLGKVRLVVIPFTNLSGDPKQDYFSASLTDEMITRLGNLDPPRLGVIAATSSNALAGKPIVEIGRALHVQYALEGSVRRDDNRVRIDVQLIQVSDQTHLWAETYERDFVDILNVQDDVATAVANQIRLTLNPSSGRTAEAVTKRTVNAEAYDAYLRGRFYWTNRGDLHKSLEAYQQAIQKDPQYALAYAGLASAYALLGQVPYDDLPPSEAKPKARDAAKRALELDPQLADAHAVLANVAYSYDWNFALAESEFQRALALGPSDPIPHIWYAQYCIVRNRLAQALEENSRTVELDPVSPLFNTVRAEVEYHSRNYDAAIEQARRTVEQYPTYPLAYIWLGSAYREKKMYAEALEQFSKGRQLTGDRPIMIALYGHTLAVSGDSAGARRALADLQRLAQSRYVSSLYFATIHSGMGEKSTALDWLDRAYVERNDRLVYLGADPIADPLRSEPRFTQLLRKIGVQ